MEIANSAKEKVEAVGVFPALSSYGHFEKHSSRKTDESQKTVKKTEFVHKTSQRVGLGCLTKVSVAL